MATISMKRCDHCSKLGQPSANALTGWRHFELPFSGEEKDVCSPGCAKNVVNQDIDEEWEKANGTTGSLVPSPYPREVTSHPVERPGRSKAAWPI